MMAFKQQRLVLRSNQPASNTASIPFTSVIDSNFSTYVLKIRDLVSVTDATTLLLTFSTDNGSTYLNTNYRYSGAYSASSGGSGNLGNSASAAAIQLYPAGVSNSSSRGLSLDVWFYDLNSSITAKISAFGVVYDSSAVINQVELGGQKDTSTNINAVKIALGTGNISTGNFYFYGVNET